MAYISFQPTDFFSPKLYTGNGTAIGSGGLAVTGVGFQPDFTWIKNREQADNHILTDAVRGATKYVNSDRTNAEATNAESLTTWGADGFTLGDHAAVNTNAEDYVSWNWKAGTTSGLTGGTITPSAYSINTTSGFSIIAYTGNGTAGATIPHGLGVVPDMVIVKKLSSTSDWFVYHSKIDATAPQDYYLSLNGTAARTNNNGEWYDTAPTSTLVTLGANTTTNTATFIAYCFASIKGYSKFGSYEGNGSADGAFIYTGFRPAFILCKRIDGVDNWVLLDNKANPNNVAQAYLATDDAGAESTNGGGDIDFLSNGFKIRTDNGKLNGSSADYISIAFAEFPIVSSNDVPGIAR